MSKKLAAKASLIQAPSPAGGSAVAEPRIERSEPTRIKTAPGSMAHFMASQSSAVKEAEALRARLEAFEGADAVHWLDPRAIAPSRWANRHADSFADAAFFELKSDIASAGGNVQPISVRRVRIAGSPPASPGPDSGRTGNPAAASNEGAALLQGPAVSAVAGSAVLNGSTPETGLLPSTAAAGSSTPPVVPPLYELVFGHRRHQACLELGLPVRAMVVELGDRELFEMMERENRSRKNLSAWEQGRMYMRALDQGLYPSQRKLSEALAVDISLVSKSLSLARLPDAVVKAFPSPLDIQFRWAQPLADALQRDPDAVLARASRVAGLSPPLAGPQVLRWLLGLEGGALNGSTPVAVTHRSTPHHRVITGVAGRQALMTRDARGRVLLRFAAGVLSDAEEAEIASLVERVLARG